MIPASAFSADALLAELTEWVRIESPTYEAATVNRMEDLIASRIGALGFSVERLPGRDGLGDILRCRRAGRSNGPGILIIAHADTVHPVGTLADKLPIRREGDKCFGPAIYDMKGGTVIALAALKAVHRRRQAQPARHHRHQPRRGDRQPDLARADRGGGARATSTC